MNRPTYWKWVLSYLGMIFANALFSELYGGDGMLVATLVMGWYPFAWYCGYWRMVDAGKHGLWAVFTPILLGTIIIGCIKSAPFPARTML